jgi:ATP-dependent HslUV protease ATP-binding subunit HslU
MVRDLLELAVRMVRSEHAQHVKHQAEAMVEKRLVQLLLGETGQPPTRGWVKSGEAARHSESSAVATVAEPQTETDDEDSHERVRRRMTEKLRDGTFEDREIEIAVTERSTMPIIGMMGPDQMDPSVTSMLENIMPERTHRRRVTVARARTILLEEETSKLIDEDKVIEQAIERTEQSGVIFLDEIDKIASSSERGRASADVSREGVQRDLLPIVEGSTVQTRYGVVKTDQVLFIAAGAFHSASVSDLMPELQGRFPIRVELQPLTREDFRRILTEPDSALTMQQMKLLDTEGLHVEFDAESVDAMAELAAEANATMENIGARRLMTVMECVFEQISFDAPDMVAQGETSMTITAEFVRKRLATIMKDQDLRKFVL